MTKRSRIALIFLGLFVFFVIISLGVSPQENNLENEINQFEQEIVDPNNDLEVLGKQNEASNYFLINLADKVDKAINKVFNLIIDVFRLIVEGIV